MLLPILKRRLVRFVLKSSSESGSEFDEVEVKAGPAGARFFLIAAAPLREPVAWGGPIVDETQNERAKSGL